MKKYLIALLLLLLLNNPAISQWEQLGLSNKQIFAIESTDSQIFACSYNTVYRSLDNGFNWEFLDSLPSGYINTILKNGEALFIGMDRGCFSFCPPRTSIFRSSNSGTSWDSVYASLYGTEFLQPFRNYLFASADGYLIRSSDTGINWEIVNTAEYGIQATSANDSTIFVSNNADSNLYRSIDDGLTWQVLQYSQTKDIVYNIATKGDIVFILSDSVYHSIDNGNIWHLAQNNLPDDDRLYEIYIEDEYIFGTSMNNQIYTTSIFDIYWENISDGLIITGNADIFDLKKYQDYILVGGSTGIWRRPLSQLVSINRQEEPLLIRRNYLEQNYPNPFNGQTTIRFSIIEHGFVEVSIYDNLGRKVETLLSETMPIGTHIINFNAKNLASGLYWYELRTNDFIERKRMLLVR